MSFAGQVAIVTGAASGMGRATALQLAREGARVALVDIDAQNGERIAAEARTYGADAVFEHVDLTDLTALEPLVARTVGRWGRLDILANVAAIYPSAPFLEVTPEIYDRTLAIGLRAVFFLTQAAARQMVTQRSGAIVQVASGAAFRPVPNLAHYSAAKGGIVAMTRTIARELAPYGVRVNVVAPGHTASETIQRTLSPEMMAQTAQSLVPGRWLTPEEVAEAIVFLAGPQATAITGAVLNVNGGDYMPH